MAVSYIDQAYIEARIGTDMLASLLSYLGNDITLSELITDASEEVLGGLRAQGYADPTSGSEPAMVKKFVFATVLDELYGIAGAEMPDTYLRVLGKYQKFIEGELQIVDLELAGNAQEIAGAKSSDTTTSVSEGGRPQRFADVRKYL